MKNNINADDEFGNLVLCVSLQICKRSEIAEVTFELSLPLNIIVRFVSVLQLYSFILRLTGMEVARTQPLSNGIEELILISKSLTFNFKRLLAWMDVDVKNKLKKI